MAKVLISVLLMGSALVLFTDASDHQWNSPKQGYYRHESVHANTEDLRCPVGMYLSVPPMSYLPEGPGSQKTLSEAKGICQALHMTLPPRSAAHCLWDFAFHSTVGNIDIGYEGVWTDHWKSTSHDANYKVKLRGGGDVDRERGSVICYAHTCNVPTLAHGRQSNTESVIQPWMTVAYRCNVGYWMNGPATVTCTANGLSGHTSCFGYYRSETRRANGDLRCPVGMYLSVPPMSYLPEGPGSQKTLSEAKGICQALHMTLPPRSAAHCLWDFAYHSTVGNFEIRYEGVWADYWLSSSADVDYKVKLRSGGDVDRE
eukprot:scpid105135/ scgid15574/ 